MNKPILVRITATRVDDKGRRLIKGNSLSSTFETEQYGPHGTDSCPINSAVVALMPTQRNGDEAIIGVLNNQQKSALGEHRIYSTDSDGGFKFNVWCRADGTLLIGDSDVPGDYTDNLTNFSPLKSEYDKTKNYILALRNATQAALVAIDAVVPGTSAAFISAMTGQVLGDISSAKNEKIKTK